MTGVTVSATATAQANAPSTSVKTNPVCILTKSTGASAFQVQSGSSLSAANCEIDVASTDPAAAVFNGSLPNVTKVCVAGGYQLNNGSTVSGLASNCTVATDTYAGALPTPSTSPCTVNGAVYGPGTVNLSPGVYCGHFNWNGPGTLNLAPGLYVLEDDWTLSDPWTVNGSGVTFYFTKSSAYLDFNGNTVVNLSPPTSGTYANILMFEPSGLSTSTSGCTGDGCFNISSHTSGNNLSGLMYLPSRNIYMQATSLNSTNFMLVANSVQVYQNSSSTVAPGASALTNSTGVTVSTPQSAKLTK